MSDCLADGNTHLVVTTFDGATTRTYVDGTLKEQTP